MTALGEDLVERDDERSAVASLVSQVTAASGPLLVVEGVAGIGKTSILDLASAAATGRGIRVLRARGSDLERDFTFGVVRQLLEPVVRGSAGEVRDRWFAGSARLARDLLTDTTYPVPVGVADPLFALLHGLYWSVVNLSDDRPVLLVVDDLQWADEPSLRFVTFLASRLSGLPVGVAVAARTGSGSPASALRELGRQATTAVLRPAPLSRDGLALVARSTYAADPEREFVTALQDATGGNPFYAHELLLDLVGEDVEPTTANAPRVAEFRPEVVVRAVVARVGRGGARAVAVARALAVLERSESEGLLTRVAGTSLGDTRSALRELTTAGVLGATGLTFEHPIIGSSLYADIPPVDRAALHRRAAELLAADGATDERVAAHLLRSPPSRDQWAVDVLRRAATHAVVSGGNRDASVLLTRALAEPPDEHLRPTVLFELGSAELRQGRPEAVDHLRLAFDSGRDEQWWPEAARSLARALTFSGSPDDGAGVLAGAAGALEPVAPLLALRLWVDWFFIANLSVDLVGEARSREPALRARLGAADPLGERMLLGAAALAGAHAAMPADDVAEQARRAWGIGDLLAVEPPDSQNHWGPIHALILAGDVDRAQPAIALLLRESRRLGAGAGLAMSRLLGTLLGLRRGTLLDAEADALDAIDLAVEHFFFAVPGAVGLASEALVERGELDRAGELFERYAFPPELLPPGFGDHYLVGRGLLRLAEQRWDEALADLMAAGNRMLAWHSPGPAVVAWRSRAALAASALGDHDTATRLASEEVALAEAYGSPHTLGLALRAAGIVARPIDRIAILERAVAVLDSTPFELEAARALTDLGTQLRHHGTVARARPVLRRGLDLAVRCGATPIAERARRELIATGARPRRSAITGAAALTGTEQRISLLAAAGRSNREIAQELFVTVKTVEAHLTNSYRKLGISSRDALGTHLGLSP